MAFFATGIKNSSFAFASNIDTIPTEPIYKDHVYYTCVITQIKCNYNS